MNVNYNVQLELKNIIKNANHVLRDVYNVKMINVSPVYNICILKMENVSNNVDLNNLEEKDNVNHVVKIVYLVQAQQIVYNVTKS